MIRGRFPPTRLFYYPHLSKDETPVWERFLAAHGALYEAIDYDVRVGHGRQTAPWLSAQDAAAWRELTAKRIDAIGYRDGVPHLFEVKQIGDAAALGQICLYRQLWITSYPDSPAGSAALVCAYLDEGTTDLAATLELDIFTV